MQNGELLHVADVAADEGEVLVCIGSEILLMKTMFG